MASRSMHALGVLVLASISAFSAACGGGGVKIDDLGDELIDALCEREVRCGAFTSVEACKAGATFDIEEIKRSIAAGRTDYDEGKAADCIDALGSASCDTTAQNVRVQPQACRDTFDGTVPDGGQCYNDEECVSESCNVPSCNMACCAGTCDPTVAEVAIGGTCGSGTGPCVVGSFCDTSGTAATCVALKPVGAACTSNSQCAYNLYCPEAGMCAEAPNRGQACPDGFCADLGDRCDATSMTCVALARQGEACQSGFAGLFDCIQPLTCNQTSLTCDNPPTAGQACLFFCADGNFCNANDQCEATKANGGACQGDEECQSQFCDANGLCAAEPICG